MSQLPPSLIALLSNTRWVELDMNRAVSNYQMTFEYVFDSIFRLMLRSLKAAPFNFIEGKQAEPKGDKVVVPGVDEEAENIAKARVWRNWISDALRHHIANSFGFASGIVNSDNTDRKYNPRIPIMLDLTKLTVLFYRDIYSQCHWRIFDKSRLPFEDNSSNLTEHWKGAEIFDFVVLGDTDTFPMGRTINSMIESLRKHTQLYKNKIEQTIIADQLRARGGGYLEEEKTTDKQTNLHPIPLPDDLDAKLAPDVAHRKSMCNPEVDSSPQAVAAASKLNKVEKSTADTQIGNLIYLPIGKKYTPISLPEGPTDTLEWRLAEWEDYCAGFGLPMKMIISGDTSGKAKLGDPEAGPESGRLYKESQEEIRVRAESYCNRMYNYINTPIKMDALKKKRKREEEIDDEELEQLRESVACVIKIERVPTQQDIAYLRESGMLKDSAAARLMGNNTGISLSDFHEKPKIDVKDLAGIKPAEGPAPKKKAKTKK